MTWRIVRIIIWFNFLTSAFHVFDTGIGIHSPILPAPFDFTIHAVGVFLWGTIALYGPRSRDLLTNTRDDGNKQ